MNVSQGSAHSSRKKLIVSNRLPSHITRIGIVTDTHIPDRVRSLPSKIFERLQGVEVILHAGDVINLKTIQQIETVAPVLAVQGNRDVFTSYGRSLPIDRIVEVGSVRIGVTHGHGGWRGYLYEKLHYYTKGYSAQRTMERAYQRFENVNAIVFGHTHRPCNKLYEGVLMFNPGSVGPDHYTEYGAAIGVLTIYNGVIHGEIIPLS